MNKKAAYIHKNIKSGSFIHWLVSYIEINFEIKVLTEKK